MGGELGWGGRAGGDLGGGSVEVDLVVVELDALPALATVDGKARILAWLGPRLGLRLGPALGVGEVIGLGIKFGFRFGFGFGFGLGV